jgi:starch synthase
MGYQGVFPMTAVPKLGVDEKYTAPLGPFEYWGDINLMKAALVFADKITTVSPTYADEICKSDEYGMGLQGVLSDRRDDLVGILNGVDYDIWSPQKDRLIPYNYIRQNLSNKKRNKLELLKKCSLPLRSEQPLLGMISRLDPQKGFDLLAKIMNDIMELELQMVLLGTGLNEYHELFESVETKYPDKFKAFLTFDNKLAHLIEAGADMFLMPSRYEPCGLNQMYSLKYGTVPIVRKTGGLADTVVDWNDETLTGTGFVFEDYDENELLAAIKRALKLFSRRRTWFKIVKQGMDQDFSWETSAREYEALYESMRAINN